MQKFNAAIPGLALLSLMVVIFSGASAALAGTPDAPAARPAAFAVCAACHSTEPGKTIVGPSLAGVGGRKAASLPGYAYSEALRNSGLAWNEATLDTWLTSPQKAVPGTKMPFAGIADPAKRKAVVNYLMTLK
ncbi:c-type cytochrome [Novosphingobium album (ex Hu et al. 2023)]|uniref:C-type cytochrome n=1 Tax=Novosphingobium album (ex Hu et al. 2023) TaxID=2930093 RepID=A0ABT0B2D7_9SPHN|nr:c-type cytochrome [Novosphingobium album (ex Hu et al. 2023)]MCJ2179228.1 c-type cytochrome [Novosphingobium album (ex Hu et al. 2023)]